MEKSPPSSGILQAGNKSGIHRLPRNAALLISHRIHGAAIYGNIYHQYTFNVSICIIHGSYGFYLMVDIRTDPLIIGEVGVRTAPRWLVPWDLWRFLFCAPWFSPHGDGIAKKKGAMDGLGGNGKLRKRLQEIMPLTSTKWYGSCKLMFEPHLQQTGRYDEVRLLGWVSSFPFSHGFPAIFPGYEWILVTGCGRDGGLIEILLDLTRRTHVTRGFSVMCCTFTISHRAMI